MIRFEGLHKVFNPGTPDENVLFQDFNLTVEDGSFVSIIGSNGSGKTTLLNLMCGSLQPDAGRILLGDTDVTAMPEHRRARRIGRVLQDPKMGTCGDLTILENLALADNKGRAYSLGRAVNRRGWPITVSCWPSAIWGWKTACRCRWAACPVASGRRWRW